MNHARALPVACCTPLFGMQFVMCRRTVLQFTMWHVLVSVAVLAGILACLCAWYQSRPIEWTIFSATKVNSFLNQGRVVVAVFYPATSIRARRETLATFEVSPTKQLLYARRCVFLESDTSDPDGFHVVSLQPEGVSLPCVMIYSRRHPEGRIVLCSVGPNDSRLLYERISEALAQE